MTQQTQFKKLKEQIEAAKRGLTEMSDTEIDDGTMHASSSSALPEIVDPKQIKMCARGAHRCLRQENSSHACIASCKNKSV